MCSCSRAIDPQMTMLETRRLRLRKVTESDAPFVLTLLTDPSFVRFIGDRGVRSIADARTYVAKGPMASYAQHGYGLYLVERLVDGTPVGICGLVRRPSLPGADLGYAFLPPFWGQGYATEAACAMMVYGFEHLNAHEFLAGCRPCNPASRNVLEKCGFSRTGRAMMPSKALGMDTPIDLFSLNRNAWTNRRGPVVPVTIITCDGCTGAPSV